MFALQRKQWKIICRRGHQSAGLKQQRQRKEQGGGGRKVKTTSDVITWSKIQRKY